MFYNFIYFFEPPKQDSNMINIFDMVDALKNPNQTNNKELFYNKMAELIKSGYVEFNKNEERMKENIIKIKELLQKNHLIKKSL